MARPTRSNFTRLQRLTCCLLLLFTTMIANAMFYRDTTEEGNPNDPIMFRIGTAIMVSRDTILISIYGSLVVVPINMIVVYLFRKSKPKYAWTLPQDVAKKQAEINDGSTSGETDVRKMLFCTDKFGSMSGKRGASYGKGGARYDPDGQDMFKKKKPELPDELSIEDSPAPKPAERKRWWKQRYPLPYWCQYIAWSLALTSTLASATFVTFYGMQWGFDKSSRWLSSIILSFFSSVVIVQPVKVMLF